MFQNIQEKHRRKSPNYSEKPLSNHHHHHHKTKKNRVKLPTSTERPDRLDALARANPPPLKMNNEEMEMNTWTNMRADCVELIGNLHHLMRRRPQGKKDAMDSQSRRVEGATTSQSSIYRALELQSYALNGTEQKYLPPHFW